MNRLQRPARGQQHIQLVAYDGTNSANPSFSFDTKAGDIVLACYMVRNYNPGNSTIKGMRTLVYRDSSSNEYTGLWGAMSRGGTFPVSYTQASAAVFLAMVLRPSNPLKGVWNWTYSNSFSTARSNMVFQTEGVNALFEVGALSGLGTSNGGSNTTYMTRPFGGDYTDEAGSMGYAPNPGGRTGPAPRACSVQDFQAVGMGAANYEQRYLVSVY